MRCVQALTPAMEGCFCAVAAARTHRPVDSDLLSVPAIRKDASTISVQFTVTPIEDDTGKLIGIPAVMHDVTKQFQETRALKRKLDER